jgi:hypothetical protein
MANKNTNFIREGQEWNGNLLVLNLELLWSIKMKTCTEDFKKHSEIYPNDPAASFHTLHYLRHNARRLEHLASLQVPVAGKSVLEVGAGIADHSHYYMDRDCTITITEARKENLQYLKMRYRLHRKTYFLYWMYLL